MPLLVGYHRFLWLPRSRRAPGLDLDEHQRLAVHRNQINLDAGCAKITLQNPVAAPPQMTFGDLFTPAPQRDPIEPGKRAQAEIAQIRNPMYPGGKAARHLHCPSKVSGL